MKCTRGRESRFLVCLQVVRPSRVISAVPRLNPPIVDLQQSRRFTLLSLLVVTLYLALLFAGYSIASFRGLGWSYLLCGGFQLILSHLPWPSLHPLNARGMTLVESVVVLLSSGVLIGIGP